MFREDRHEPLREAPVLAGLALIAVGALLTRVDARPLEMPRRRNDRESAVARFRGGDRVGALAQESRDTVLDALPSSLASGIGRSVIIAGVGLLAARALDWLAGDS